MQRLNKTAAKLKVINLYGGPGSGKSTLAAALFSQLKDSGILAELVTEYAKDLTWGNRQAELDECEYVFAKQHSRLRRLVGKVDIVITDSPILMSTVYIPENYYLPSLRPLIREAYSAFDNLDVFVVREKTYEPKGRNQTEDEAKQLDKLINVMVGKFDGYTSGSLASRVSFVTGLMNIKPGWDTL